jgi:alkaline phosphatase D
VSKDPFTLGVASGDPTSDGVVLWTRLATDPLAGDGHGGMPAATVELEWQLASDDKFATIVRSGTVPATHAAGHTVHVEVSGLAPHTFYWYRFRVGSYVSQVGRTRTAPPADVMVDELKLCFISCAQYEHGFFGVYRSIVEDEPDLVLHLGDYMYEYKAHAYKASSGNVRDFKGPETVTLANYRQRYAQYRTDHALRNAHAIAPWLVIFDDHEVDNNWAGDVPEHPAEKAGFLKRRAAAFQAYYENMPLRRASIPDASAIQIYRRAQWGRLATFHLLDTRQFRDDQGCGDHYRTDCPAAVDPRRSITGGTQEQWLLDGFRASHAQWDLVGQQVFFAQADADPGPAHKVNMDSWDGYAASRRRITQGWVDANVRNPVVLSGDVHSHWACDLKLDYDDRTSKTVGAELVCSSITSGGDGEDSEPSDNPYLKINPHIRFYNNLRGYVRASVKPDTLTADFRCLSHVSKLGAPPFTRASFAIEDGTPGLHQTFDKPPVRPETSPTDQERIDRVIDWQTERP